MSNLATILDGLEAARKHVDEVRSERSPARVVLAAGCFDPLHAGHVRYIAGAASAGGYLILAVNDDASTRRIKGADRPVLAAADRATVLASFEGVDAVVVHDIDDTAEVADAVAPDVTAVGDASAAERLQSAGVTAEQVGGGRTHSSDEVMVKVREAQNRGADAG